MLCEPPIVSALKMFLKFLQELKFCLFVALILDIGKVFGTNDISTLGARKGSAMSDVVLDLNSTFTFENTPSDTQLSFSTTPKVLRSHLSLNNQKILLTKPFNLLSVCNSSSPCFTQELYEGVVKTDDEKGTVILTVKITQVRKNNNIKYYFPPKTQTLYGDLFDINEKSGVITLKSNLKSQANLINQMKFLVMAEIDSNLIPLSTSVQIRIINSNSHRPEITFESPYTVGFENELTIEENNENINLALISVSDDDSGDEGMVDCQVDSKGVELVRLNEKNFQLLLKEALDYEEKNIYKIEISCKDFGDPPLLNSLEITLKVTDTDDNPPVFNQNSYSVKIVENSLKGTNILKLDVSDRDSNEENKNVYFFIEPHFEHLFAVDQSSRMLSTLASFDREVLSHYSFHVFAKGGRNAIDVHSLSNTSSEHIAKTLVHVTIVDVDDEIAKFTQPWFKFEVNENQPPGTFVGRVVANDADLPPNNRFNYFIASSVKQIDNRNHDKIKKNTKNLDYKEAFPFYVDANTGEIKTTAPLDRETKSKFDFKVYAGNESTTVYVEVKDLNDNSPIFEVPSPKSCIQRKSLKIEGNLTLSRHLSQLSASDLDKDDTISYSIIAGNDFNQFGIDANSGELFWNSYLPGLKNNQGCSAHLKVKAQDSVQHYDIACLKLDFEECLLQVSEQQRKSEELSKKQSSGFLAPFTDFYFLIIVVVLVCCVVIVIILTSAICITKQKTKKLKQKARMMMLQDHDLKSNLQLSRSEADTLLVLNRSHDESSDQLTGILVSLKSVEQLQRLQLRSLAPSRDSLMSTSTSVCKERDGDSGYADVASPV